MYRSYRLYLGRLEAEKERVEVEKRHVEQIASLNMRTIEALALAIEAKDHTTHTHLQRVRTYAVAVATDLHLAEGEIEALRAAALLHDIGKLAVPEQIINKPGKLTAEEFEKMKVHPLVGAEILERVAFPYPVARRSSGHTTNAGTVPGYPEGLSVENRFRLARIVGRRGLSRRTRFTPAISASLAAGRGDDKSKRDGRKLVRSEGGRDSGEALRGVGAHGADVGSGNVGVKARSIDGLLERWCAGTSVCAGDGFERTEPTHGGPGDMEWTS